MDNLKIWQEKDVDLSAVSNKKIAVIGYGAQGQAQALCMRDSGLDVIVGNRPGKSFDAAKKANFDVMSVREAVIEADIIHILLPDEHQGEIFAADIAPYLSSGRTLSFSHGFSIVYKEIVPPPQINVMMVAPKGIATQVRNKFLSGSGVPGLISVRIGTQETFKIALAMAHGMGLTRAGVMECSMEQETIQALGQGGSVRLLTVQHFPGKRFRTVNTALLIRSLRTA